jgi:putative membrane protein
MGILVLKSIHIISFVAWFAGLFYLVRLLIIHSEAQKKAKPEKDILINQFRLMERKAYKVVCNPAMMITWTCGLLILHFYGLEW